MTRRTRLLAALGLLTASTWMLQQAVDSAKETRRTKAAKARLDRDPPTRITAADEAHAGHHVHADDHPAIEAPHRPGAAPGISSPAILPPEALLAELADLPDTATYAPRQLLVEAESAEQLVMLAEANGYGVVLGRGGSPMGVLVLPEGADVDVALQVLGNTPGVLAADRNGVVRGAWYGSRDSSREAEETVSYSHLQWHLDDAGFSIPPEWRSTIAVLDSGMAYRTVSRCWCTDYQSFTEAPSLKEVDVDDPWDFVSSDRYPDDEHGHGTHITSLIASEGAVQGAAAGVDIMPYRVLDENNVGLESHLVDALWWATVMRADVVNMSLSFGPDYQPSASLHNQLEATAERGVVMVAAAGNTGGVGASWPAASPHVIGVGSSCMAGDGHSLADYSNMGSDVSVLAPGGCLDNDDNEDGHPDGLLAETFAIGQPDRIGLYWAQGTSQAAALVSSAAARLLYRGVDADSVEEVLQSSGWTVKTDDGLDFASLDYAGAGAYVSSPITPSQGYRVAMLPWVAEESGELVPRVELVVLDESLQPVDGVTVRGHFKGSTSSSFSCTTVDGACDASGKGAVDALGSAGWTVTVGRVGEGKRGRTPQSVILLTESLDATFGALADALGTVPPVGYALPEGFFTDAVEAWAFVSTGSGVTTSPFGVVLTDPFFDSLGATTSDAFDGSGVTTSPFGVLGIDLDGDGGLDLLAVQGSGVTTSPFGVVLGGYPDPAECLGSAVCDTSVLESQSGVVVGNMSHNSEAAALFMQGSGTADLVDSCELVSAASADSSVAALTDSFQLLTP